MSHLISSISEQISDAEIKTYQANVQAMSAQECSHLVMVAFDEMN